MISSSGICFSLNTHVDRRTFISLVWSTPSHVSTAYRISTSVTAAFQCSSAKGPHIASHQFGLSSLLAAAFAYRRSGWTWFTIRSFMLLLLSQSFVRKVINLTIELFMSSSTKGTSNAIAIIAVSSNSFLLPNLCLYFNFFLDKLRQLEASALKISHIICFGRWKVGVMQPMELTIIVSTQLFLFVITLLMLLVASKCSQGAFMLITMISLWSNHSVLNQDQGQLHLD